MKTVKCVMLLATLAGGLFVSAVCRAADAPTNAPAAADAPKPATPDGAPPPDQTPNTTPQPVAEQPGATNAIPESTLDATNKVLLANGETGFLMNFRDVPLERVLDYLSSAAGFIINPEGSVKGTVTVWSNQPLSTNDAVKVLEQTLSKNGYVLLRNDNLLTISTPNAARINGNTPVKRNNEPEDVPRTAEVVTQIIPVHSLNAIQLVKDLAPLLPSDTPMAANDAGNSLIITDTQSDIRRIMEIVKILDSVSSSINTLQVMHIKFADAKAVATIISSIFPSQNTGGPNGGGFGRFRGGGGGPFGGFNPFAGNNNNGGNDGSTGHTPATRVSATSDDHSNSLIVSAPEDLMTLITNMVTLLDQPVDAATEVHVFHLKNADPTETTSELAALFPDESNSTDASRTGPQFNGFRNFFGGGFPGGRGQQPASTEPSDRMKLLGRVIAVADPRTSSVIVTAAKEMMPQIQAMIEELDANPGKRMRVHSYQITSADPLDVQTTLQNLFTSTSTSANRYGNSSGTTPNALLQRQNTGIQNQGTGATTFTGGFGNTGGAGRGSAIP